MDPLITAFFTHSQGYTATCFVAGHHHHQGSQHHRPQHTDTCHAHNAHLASPLHVRDKILLIKRYILYKVLACSTTFFQLSLFCATFFQLLMFMLFISSNTLSFQRVLGLPIGLLDMGFHLLIICTMRDKIHIKTYRCFGSVSSPLCV